jgi:hypothetical protein
MKIVYEASHGFLHMPIGAHYIFIALTHPRVIVARFSLGIRVTHASVGGALAEGCRWVAQHVERPLTHTRPTCDTEFRLQTSHPE